VSLGEIFMTAELEALAYELEEDLEDEDISTLEHSFVAGKIYNKITNYLESSEGKNLGLAFESSAEYRFLQNLNLEQPRKRKLGKPPDVSFVRKEKLPVRLRVYPNIVPDLVVEVASPTDKLYEIEAKVAIYQEAGVSLVWVAHPLSRRIDVYRPQTALTPESVDMSKELSGENIIPGFVLKIADIFVYPSDLDPEPDRA
jgi:Uma2 family endonuclease